MDASVLLDLLDARERRYCLRERRVATCVSIAEVSLAVPGWPKTTAPLRVVFDRGVAALTAQLGVAACDVLVDDAGYFALFATAHDVLWLKCQACDVEEATPWGRLLDVDCHCATGKITREAIGRAARRCLLCEEPHDVCISARRHPRHAVRAEAMRLAATAVERLQS